MSSMIVGMTLVKSDGKVVKVKKGDPEFGGVTTNLGCLGIVYSVTLQCEDLFAIEHSRKIVSLDEFLANYKKWYVENEFLQAYIKQQDKNPTVSVYFRKRVPINNKAQYDRIAKEGKKTRNQSLTKTRTDFSHYILTKNAEASFYTEMEIAVPKEVADDAMMDAVRLHQEARTKKDGYKSQHPILIRFVKADTNPLMSMVTGRDSVFINIFNAGTKAKSKVLLDFFKLFQDTMVNKYDGRPHWGKQNFLSKDIVKKVYGKSNVDKFKKIRDKMDPPHMFTNEYIEKII